MEIQALKKALAEANKIAEQRQCEINRMQAALSSAEKTAEQTQLELDLVQTELFKAQQAEARLTSDESPATLRLAKAAELVEGAHGM